MKYAPFSWYVFNKRRLSSGNKQQRLVMRRHALILGVSYVEWIGGVERDLKKAKHYWEMAAIRGPQEGVMLEDSKSTH